MQQPRKIKHHRNYLLDEFLRAVDCLWEEEMDADYEAFSREPGDESRGLRWQQAPDYIEHYPSAPVGGPDMAFLIRENAMLRALQDLNAPFVARWDWHDLLPNGYRAGYCLSGCCLVCQTPLAFHSYEWEPPYLVLEEYLSEAFQCEHIPQMEVDEETFEIMLSLELLAA